MYIEIKKRDKSKYYYLSKSLRINGKYKKIRVYLGKNLDIKKLKLEASKKRKSIEEKINLLKKQDPLFSLLTESEIKEIEKIKKRFGKFSRNGVALKKFLEWFEVSFTYNTTAIEGSTLSLEEISLILTDKLSPEGKSLKEIKEIENHKKAFEYILSYKGDINKKVICKLHRILTKDILPEKYSGKFRDVRVFIRGVEVIPPKPKDLENEFRELMKWYRKNKKRYNPVVVGTYFHAAFESIHPFVDFNGRVGRLILNFFLFKNGLPMVNIKNKEKLKYYKALKEANKENLKYLVKLVMARLKETARMLE
jgi:Fic family protein